MTRPGIVRADTLDLQDQVSPSAQDHTRQPAHTSPLGAGPTAPHQYAELQHVQDEREAEQEHLIEAWTGRSSHDEDPDDDDEEDDHQALLNSVNGDDGRSSHQNGDGVNDHGDINDAENDNDDGLDDEMMDKISSSPSIEDEDIDFQFVYALHTFVATVEGQANATKGDTMVLLDDSNSYWWLVKVVKDSSIGYLPAEHIETPTERLARLNKHRNIDLCAVMLSDNQEKKKNPLKKAIRRRGTPKVEFSMPTYHEPPDVDWSDEENGNDDSPTTEESVQASAAATQSQPEETVEEQVTNGLASAAGVAATTRSGIDLNHEDASQGRQVEDNVDEELPPRRSKEGTLRNTDSFFKDDTAEPRKISLTPNLLRDDSSGRSSESSQKGADIWDRIEKTTSPVEKPKEEKKKKEKKPGMLSGLFKKKDKKVKVDEASGGLLGTSAADSGRASPSARTLQPATQPASLRQTKLQKSPSSPISKVTTAVPTPVQNLSSSAATAATALIAGQNVSASKRDSGPVDPLNGLSKEEAGDIMLDDKTIKRASSSSISDYSSGHTSQAVAKDITTITNPGEIKPLSIAPQQETRPHVSQTPPLAIDTSFQDATSHSPITATPEGSPNADGPLSDPKSSTDISSRSMPESASPNTTTSSSPATTPVATTPPPLTNDSNWDCASLRSYMDDSSNSDVKNLLLLVHDKTGVMPLSRDHPIMVGLGFQDHQKKINDMSSRLDGLLNGYLAKKSGKV